jgi:UDP-glucose 4-epimerase
MGMGKFPVLVTGGAGFIGSHVCLALLDADWPVVVLDNLSAGSRDAVPESCEFLLGDVGDRGLVEQVLRKHKIGAVLHLAGSVSVADSMTAPLEFYANNTCASRSLLEATLSAGITRFVFSSSAAVYGTLGSVPVSETSATSPISPYGVSKLMTEWMLRDVSVAHDFHYLALRPFNVAGADPGGRAGQRDHASSHLIKVACEVAVGKRQSLEIYGTDYPTPDGTCVRDFIHVSDLADIHLRALEYLSECDASMVLNCGYGRGFSVIDVVEAVARVNSKPITVKHGTRRAGDPAQLVADISALVERLNWVPRYDNLDRIVGDALKWEQGLL